MTDRLKVMLIDDEPIVGKRLKPALMKIGCDVTTFTDPSAALKELSNHDVVVTDIRMDDIDGMQILDLVKKEHKGTLVILITGYAMMSLAREAMAKGAFDFIAKPFKPDDLRAVIAKAADALGKSVKFKTDVL